MDTGVVQYPCGRCELEVKDGDQAIQCEGHSSAWFHCSCGLGLNLTDVQYERLSLSQEKWICGNCCCDYSLQPLRWHSRLSEKVNKNSNLGYSHDRGLS